MKKAVLILITILVHCITFANGNPSKTVVVEGCVVDAGNGEPITGARIIIEETGEVAYSDENGRFTLSHNNTQTASLRIEFVSFQTTKLDLSELEQQRKIELVELP
jgi:hypothetical protein